VCPHSTPSAKAEEPRIFEKKQQQMQPVTKQKSAYQQVAKHLKPGAKIDCNQHEDWT
jgi:hypothetical protein